MNAIELTLAGKSRLRRNLDLRAAVGRISTVMYLVGSKSYRTTPLAYANAAIADCYLHIDKGERASLWMGSAAFDVSIAEAELIRSRFEPLGLRIEITPDPTAQVVFKDGAFAQVVAP